MACHPGRHRLGRTASGPGCSTHTPEERLGRSARQRCGRPPLLSRTRQPRLLRRSRLRLSLLIQDAYLGVAEEFCAAEPNFEALVASGAMAPQLAALLQAAATEANPSPSPSPSPSPGPGPGPSPSPSPDQVPAAKEA